MGRGVGVGGVWPRGRRIGAGRHVRARLAGLHAGSSRSRSGFCLAPCSVLGTKGIGGILKLRNVKKKKKRKRKKKKKERKKENAVLVS